jgi:hypothetical protein
MSFPERLFVWMSLLKVSKEIENDIPEIDFYMACQMKFCSIMAKRVIIHISQPKNSRVRLYTPTAYSYLKISEVVQTTVAICYTLNQGAHRSFDPENTT